MSETLAMPAPKPPTPVQVDALVKKYHDALEVAASSKAIADTDAEAADVLKRELTEMVQTHGFRHTEKSKKIAGPHGWAMATTGTRTSVNAAAVENFRTYLGKSELAEISGRFFTAQTTYSLVDGPREVLAKLELGTRIRNKIESLIAMCFEVKTNAPSLKIEWTAAEKPKKSQVA